MRQNLIHRCAILAMVCGVCGCQGEINTAKVNKHITKAIFKQIKVKLKEMSCPEKVPEEKGKSFDCTATAHDGSTAKVQVDMMGEGTIQWKVVAVTKAVAPSIMVNGFE